MGLLSGQSAQQQIVQIVCSNMGQALHLLRACLDNSREQLVHNKDGLTFEQCLAAISAEPDAANGTVAAALLPFYADAVAFFNKYAGQAKLVLLADLVPAGIVVEVSPDKTVIVKN